MKPFIILILLHFSMIHGATAELSLCLVESSLGPGVSEVHGRSGTNYLVGKPLLTLTPPAEITLENRMVLTENLRHGWFSVSGLGYFNLPLTKEHLDLLVKTLPQDRTSRLAVILDNFVIGLTPYTRDWRKWGCGVAGTVPQAYESEEVKRLQAAKIKVVDKVARSFADFERNKGLPSEVGAIEDLICRRKTDNPLQVHVNPPQQSFLIHEPVQAALTLRNIGMDQALMKVTVRSLLNPADDLKALTSTILVADANHRPPARGEDCPFLKEGESKTVDLNLTRSVGCEFAAPGTGPVSLQFRLETQPGSYAAQHDNHNAWLDLPAPEVKVVAFAKEQFQALQTVAVTDAHDTVRVGTYLLDGTTITVAVYTKAGAVRRILRLDPNPDTKTWEMAWDGKAQQLHILGRGTKTRYWMSAADQLGWEVRADVGDRSKLETADGQVRRVE